MRKTLLITIIFLSFFLRLTAQELYFPPAGEWEEKSANEYNLDFSKALEFAKANEYSESKDLRQAILKGFQHEAEVLLKFL